MQEAATICLHPSHKLTIDLLTSKVLSESCDMGYLCANFSLPRPLCFRLRSDVCDRQTDVRQTDVRRAASLNACALWGQGHNNCHKITQTVVTAAAACGFCLFSINYSRLGRVPPPPVYLHNKNLCGWLMQGLFLESNVLPVTWLTLYCERTDGIKNVT